VANWDKNIAVEDILEGSYDEEDKNPEEDEKWYEEMDWWSGGV
jgi:hypothetical protein